MFYCLKLNKFLRMKKLLKELRSFFKKFGLLGLPYPECKSTLKSPLSNVNKHGVQRHGTFGMTDPVYLKYEPQYAFRPP